MVYHLVFKEQSLSSNCERKMIKSQTEIFVNNFFAGCAQKIPESASTHRFDFLWVSKLCPLNPRNLLNNTSIPHFPQLSREKKRNFHPLEKSLPLPIVTATGTGLIPAESPAGALSGASGPEASGGDPRPRPRTPA